MSDMRPYKNAIFEKARAEQKRCKEWLMRIMRASRTKTRSKDDLRAEAIRDLGVSKNSFDMAWIGAIEKLGYHDWYEPLRKGRRPARKKLH